MSSQLRLPGVREPEGGVALVIVLLILSLLLAIVGEFAQAMRLEAVTTANFRGAIVARHLAEAGYHRALAEILPDAVDHELDEHGLLIFRRARVGPEPPPARTDLALGAGRFSYRITDEEARLNLNRLNPDQLRRLLAEFGVERATQDVIADSILDWRDPNEEHRLNGAESDYYLTLTPPYRSKNADFDSVDELGQVRGVTREILYGRPESPGLAEYLTVAGSGAMNVNTVSPLVLRAFGFAQAEVDLLVARRPYPDVSALPGNLRRGNQRVRSETFRIEAWGEVEGRAGQTLVAIVQRRVQRDGLMRATLLSWRWLDTPPPDARPAASGETKS